MILLIGLIVIIFASLIGSVGVLYFKYASNDSGKKVWGNKYFYLGIILNGISALVYIYALRFGDLSALYPVTGLSYIWVSLLSIKYLNERMSGYKWLGVGLILLGVILVGIGG